MPRILVVDDEAGGLKACTELSCTRKVHTTSCHTAHDAIKIVQANRPDVVLVDLTLPDGLAAYDRIRDMLPELPVIVITASEQTETAIEAMRRGAFDYLVKPIDTGRLRGVVDRAIKFAHLNRSTRSNVGVPSADVDDDTMAAGDVFPLECLPPSPLSAESAFTDSSNHHVKLPALERLARELLDAEPGGAYRRIISMVDEVVLREALGYAKGNQLHAAALLGISRTTLRAKLRSMGLSVEKHLSNGRNRT